MPSRGGGKGQLLVLHMQISPGTTSAMQASQNAVDFQGKGVLLSLLFLCCSHLRSAFWLSSPSNVFTIPRPPPLSGGFHVFGPLKKVQGIGVEWKSVSSMTKMWSRWHTNGYLQHQRTFLLEVSIHYQSAETLVLHSVETTLKNDEWVSFSLFQFFSFSFDSPSYN